VHVGDQNEQTRELLAAFDQSEFLRELDLVGLVRRARRNADDLRLRLLGL